VRRIARVLRGWRESTGEQSGAIARRAGWSAAKQSRLETGGQTITPADVMTLALILEVTEDERRAVFNAALTAQEKGWWEELATGALTDDAFDYVELESAATGLTTFKIDLVHGLFQTPEYAAALVRAFVPQADEDTTRRRVAARVRRQDRLVGDRAIEAEVVLAEGALHLRIGGPKVMRAQLNRLLELGELPNVHVRVLPSSAGAHPTMGVGYSILTFGGAESDESDESDVVYIELPHKGIYEEGPAAVDPYRLRFAGVREIALAEKESAALIAKIARTMKA